MKDKRQKMKPHTKLTIGIYILELFVIGIIIGGIYFFTKQILDANPELVSSGFGLFGVGILTHKYLSKKWMENKHLISKLGIKTKRMTK